MNSSMSSNSWVLACHLQKGRERFRWASGREIYFVLDNPARPTTIESSTMARIDREAVRVLQALVHRCGGAVKQPPGFEGSPPPPSPPEKGQQGQEARSRERPRE